MLIHIKNMVCPRCVMAVQDLLSGMQVPYAQVELGLAEISKALSEKEIQQLSDSLHALGFELISDHKSQLIEQVKNSIIQLARNANGEKPEQNISQLLSAKLHYDYNHLSSLFSEAEGITIEKYFIAQRIEFVKELLVYDELTLSQIAYQLGYSSSAHLSNQFKKVTGLTPSYFKKIKENKRKFLTDL